jgi:hypothetical protein
VAEYRIHNDINMLPQYVFEDCMCDQKYEGLLIDGELPSELKDKILYEAWIDIWYQYVDFNWEGEALYTMDLKREIAVLENEIKLVECGVQILRSLNEFDIDPPLELYKSLSSIGVRINGLDHKKPDYDLRLKRIVLSLAPKKMRLSDKIKELIDYIEAHEEEGATIDRSYFTTWRVRLSRFQNYRLDPKTIMVPEFLIAIKDYLEYHSSKKKQIEDGTER